MISKKVSFTILLFVFLITSTRIIRQVNAACSSGSIPNPAPNQQCSGTLQAMNQCGPTPSFAVIQNIGDTLIISAQGTDNQVWVEEWNITSQSFIKTWYIVNGYGPTTSSQKLVINPQNLPPGLYLYAQSIDGNIYYAVYQSPGSWSSWVNTGICNSNFGSSGPTSVQASDGNMYSVSGSPITLYECLITTTTQTTNNNIIAGYYEFSTMNSSDGRTSAQLLSGIHANFVMRGWFKYGWYPVGSNDFNNWFSNLQNNIKEIKASNPNTIYQVAFAAWLVKGSEYWPNGTIVSDSDFQSMIGRDSSGLPISVGNNYLYDVSSPVTQKYLTLWSEKLIDAGANSIFYDEPILYAEQKIIWQDPNVVMPAYAGYWKVIIDSVKSYAASKGTNVLICNPSFWEFPQAIPYAAKVDMVSWTFAFGQPYCAVNDFISPFDSKPTALMLYGPLYHAAVQQGRSFNNWQDFVSTVQNRLGYSPIILSFIDYGNPGDLTPMYYFSNLSTQDQITVLQKFTSATKTAGVVFAYPLYLYGGTSPPMYDSTRTSDGGETYSIIRTLALSQISTTSSTTILSTTSSITSDHGPGTSSQTTTSSITNIHTSTTTTIPSTISTQTTSTTEITTYTTTPSIKLPEINLTIIAIGIATVVIPIILFIILKRI